MTIQTTIGGVTAPPSRDAPCVRPCAKPRRLIGIQCKNARVAAANAPPSPTPTRNRHTINAGTPVATPLITVATLHSALNSERLRRGAEELALRLRKAQLDHSRREQFLSALLAAPATGATRVTK